MGGAKEAETSDAGIVTLLILQIEPFTLSGEKVPNADRTSAISRGPIRPKLNLSMPPLPS
jgi:hypothetical protein